MELAPVFLITAIVVLIGCNVAVFINRQDAEPASDSTQADAAENTSTQSPANNEITDNVDSDVTAVQAVDFQPVIDEWARTTSGDKGVAVFDLDRGELAGEYNATQKFATASLYKLFVVYQGYKMLKSGELDMDAKCGYTGYTILECLDLSIRESNSECAETIWKMIGYDELDRLMRKEAGLDGLTVSNLEATPLEVMNIMRKFYAISGELESSLASKLNDSFINQPVTEYNWRQGLPSGFSDDVTVMNKVGWEWNEDDEYWSIYNDAAIIEFTPQMRHFVVVVMTNGVSYTKIRELGTRIEQAFLDAN